MSERSRERLPPEVFELPVEKIREGYYTDAYFNHTRSSLLADGRHPRVLMQVFQKNEAVLGGMDEAIAILRLLWSGETVEHHGKHYSFPKLTMSPAPKKPIPIYCGGLSEAALMRAGRRCDGWISVVHTVDEIRDFASRLHAIRKESGRTGEFEVIVACNDAFDLDGYKRLEAAGATASVSIPLGYPVTFNDPPLTRRMAPTLKRVARDGKADVGPPITGAEDFSFFQQKIPGLYFFLGVVPDGVDPATAPKNHSPLFFADEKALPVGVRALTQLTLDYMAGGKVVQ